MHDGASAVERRLRRLVETRLRPATAKARAACTTCAYPAPGRNLAFAAATGGPFRPLPAGEWWGAAFSTWWMAVDGDVPSSFAGGRIELRVDLGFDAAAPGFQAEALAFDASGVPLKAVTPRNAHLRLDAPGPFRVYLEAAANPTIAPDRPHSALLGDPRSAGDAPLYRFGGAEIVLVDDEADALCHDLDVLGGLAGALAPDDPWRHELLATIAHALDAIDPADPARGACAARARLAPLLARPAGPHAAVAVAVGHAHIDTAWLWPLEETPRKCARTIANVTALAEDYDDLVFAFSQAQQWAWVKSTSPLLWERLQAAVARDQIVAVGGMWVEADTNIPGGEALARQLLYGQLFFLEHCGRTCEEGWLPDCFGYSAALPQLLALAGMSGFVTQKLSWNDTNRFPHHTFSWEGIDGTRVLTHFPPVDTYNAELTPSELLTAGRNVAESGAARHSLVPFGYGDGGGGPTREMLERARRLSDLEGAPRVSIGPPARFFAAASAERAAAPVWVGELYLERHRGTLTSQAALKALNRRVELLLREAELWAATAAVRGVAAYPHDELEDAWKLLLVRQFHDILPGSSIAAVNDEAAVALGALAARLEGRILASLAVLAGPGERALVANARPQPAGPLAALGIGEEPVTDAAEVRGMVRAGGGFCLDNGALVLECDERGLIVSLVDRLSGRELVPAGAASALLELHPDLPAEWDAWDLEAATLQVGDEIVALEEMLLESAPGRVALRVRRRFGRSSAETVLSLAAGERRVGVEVVVDWHEVEHLLTLAFALDLHTAHESAEIQFGHLDRPIHENTSWDVARFERSAHRFVHLGEAGYGVALTNTATYGHSTARHARPGGGTTTTLRWSLLRGARFPDPRADAGTHRFGFALYPGADLAAAVAAGYADNIALRRLRGAAATAPVVSCDNPAVVLEAVKCAEDRSGDLVVRLYESLGGRAHATVHSARALVAAWRTDLLERPTNALALRADAHDVAVEMRPFEITTLRLRCT